MCVCMPACVRRREKERARASVRVYVYTSVDTFK